MMNQDTHITVNSDLAIPRAELDYRATRAGGPGGQHVNTSSTKVELLWDVAKSPSITDEQRDLVMQKLRKRIGEDGMLRLTSATSRSQHQNKEDVTERFARMLADALRVPKRRKKTKMPRAVKEARLKAKKNRSRIKQQRGRVSHDE
ncbi:MAG TPA: alternative ribosome rescue aminoacyl-tRNA hydrolase ArfB [Longimicrobiales bacterium]